MSSNLFPSNVTIFATLNIWWLYTSASLKSSRFKSIECVIRDSNQFFIFPLDDLEGKNAEYMNGY